MNNTNRLLFGKTSSIVATVSRAIERAERDPRYTSSELTAHKCAWAERLPPDDTARALALFEAQLAAEAADMDVMAKCSKYPGAAFCLAAIEAGRAM